MCQKNDFSWVFTERVTYLFKMISYNPDGQKFGIIKMFFYVLG